MLYTSTESKNGQGIVLPISHFAQSEDEFLYRVNPFLPYRCSTMSEFCEMTQCVFYGLSDVDSVILNGEPVDISLGAAIHMMPQGGYEQQSVELFRVILESGLNSEPSFYAGGVTIVMPTVTGNTSYVF